MNITELNDELDRAVARGFVASILETLGSRDATLALLITSLTELGVVVVYTDDLDGRRVDNPSADFRPR